MSLTKETFYTMAEYDAMTEYLEDDLQDRSPESLKFHQSAVNQKVAEICTWLNIHPNAIQHFHKWFISMLNSDDDLLDEHNDTRIETAERLFNYYRQNSKVVA